MMIFFRDIKGANIMLMSNGIIKLIDFGCAKRLCLHLSVSQSEVLKSMKGLSVNCGVTRFFFFISWLFGSIWTVAFNCLSCVLKKNMNRKSCVVKNKNIDLESSLGAM